MAVTEPDTDTITVMASTQVMKALALETPLPTPDGWTTMGAVQTGDRLFDEQGQVCRVLGVTEALIRDRCLEVEFSDGAVVVCDDGHRWLVDDNAGQNVTKAKKLITTEEMLGSFRERGRNRYAIPLSAALELPDADLTIPPYAMGVWLGDGHSYSTNLTIHEKDREIVSHLEHEGVRCADRSRTETGVLTIHMQMGREDHVCRRGHNMNDLGRDSRNGCAECARNQALASKWKRPRQSEVDVDLSSMGARLLKLGLLKGSQKAREHNAKAIPPIYSRSSFSQRLALLQGLMDTDGTIGKNGRSSFSTVDENMAHQVLELVASLGLKGRVYSVATRCPTIRGVVTGDAYQVSFLAYADIPVFRLTRKLERQLSREGRRASETTRRRVVDVRVVPARPVKCIAVDSPSHLYLCGREMIPTHNTEFLQNIAGYFIHQDPASILFVQPTQKMAEDFSKERFAPTRETTPVLRGLIPDAKSRDSGVTITHKGYPGGTLDFVGANSPVDLASRPKRIVLSDEIDKYPASAGPDGDPLSLAEERSSTFWNRKKVRACSPTNEMSSRIAKEYAQSDQRRCFVECPHCGEDQMLRFSPETVIWDKDEDGNHRPETARYYCQTCGVGWSEAERIRALRGLLDKPDKGWRQTKAFRCCGVEHQPSEWTDKGRSLCPSCREPSHYTGHAGFHVSKLYSTRHRLSDVVKEWLGSHKDREKLRKFVNTALAEVWKEKVERLDPKALAARAEPYSSASVPEAVRLIVFGADTQDDRIEVTFLGFGADEECWVLRHDVINGETAQKRVWEEFDERLKEPFDLADGRRLLVQAGCVDSQGHRGSMVHDFCRIRKNRRIYPVKGQANDPRGSKLIWPKTPSRTKNSGDRLYIVGVDTAKDALAARLTILPDDLGGAAPFAIHFPQTGLSADYFEQLTAEKAVTVIQNGREFRRWQPKSEGIRNEALDCFVYGLAARLSLPEKLRAMPSVKVERADPEPKSLEAEPVGAPVEPRPQVIRPVRASRGRWNTYR